MSRPNYPGIPDDDPPRGARDEGNEEGQKELTEALQRMRGMQVVVQLIDVDHWMAKSRRYPECFAHGATINDAIIRLDRMMGSSTRQ